MESDISPQNSQQKGWLIFSAWASILLVSDLPDMLFNAIAGQIPGWLLWGKSLFLVLFFWGCYFWKPLRPLRPYAVVMLVFLIALSISDWVRTSAWWQGVLSTDQHTFLGDNIKPFIRDLGVALLVLAALWVVKRRRSEFFLVKGQMDAPVEPVRWLGIKAGESWRIFGWIFAISAALAVAIPTVLALQSSGETLLKIIPLLPVVLLFAAINAFTEELYFRSTLLSTLPQAIGKNHALLISMAFFGLAHFLYGSPPGIIGFLMTGFLAYLLGKSMLETKGFAWPWIIHFISDVVVFASYAIVWVQS